MSYQSKISLLADCPHEADTIAIWYFQEWGDGSTDSVGSIREKVLLGVNRHKVPIAFVAHIQGELSGVGEIKYRELPEYPEFNYWLDGIYVPVGFRGNGISTQLIEFAKQKTTELKIPSLYLRCRSHNLKLYEARGFQVVKKEREKFIMGFHLLQY